MTAREGAILSGNNALAKRKLLKKNCGIDFDQGVIKGNKWENEVWKVQFTSIADYGAKSKGWTGYVDITDAAFCTEPEVAGHTSPQE